MPIADVSCSRDGTSPHRRSMDLRTPSSCFVAAPASLRRFASALKPTDDVRPRLSTSLERRSAFIPHVTSVRLRHVSSRKRKTPSASASSDASASPVPSPKVTSFLLSAVHCIASLALLIFIQRGVGHGLAALGISFPAPLAAMLLLFVLLSAMRMFSSPFVDRLNTVLFNPSVAFLTRWLAVFFVPNLVMLPLAPSLPSAHVAKIGLIIVCGFFFTLLSTAVVCIALRSMVSLATGKPPASLSVTSSKGSPPSNPLILVFAVLSMFSFALATRSVRHAATAYALFATLLTFTVGQRFPSGLKMFLHPLVTCTCGTIGAMALLGTATSTPFSAMLATYYTRGAAWGAGDILASLLGPAVITFAFTMDRQRKLALARVVEVVFGTLFATLASLFGTAFAARLLKLPADTALLVLPRTVTAPLAVAIADLLGANMGLAASVVALTGLLGANIAASVLTAFRVKDPVVRGLSVGASAHGLGTAALSDEGGAFPFAALAMTLVGIFSTVFIAFPPLRLMVIRVAVGLATKTAVQ
ncbi:hypothetical protein FGB62_34g128 [Gracilaria domingensis]|nr:hypothetical protein FGB62_34g128 [Gracilaria domingensis]